MHTDSDSMYFLPDSFRLFRASRGEKTDSTIAPFDVANPGDVRFAPLHKKRD